MRMMAQQNKKRCESESEVAQSYLTLSDPMDCSLPGSSVHGIFQARLLESGANSGKELICQCRRCKSLWFHPSVGSPGEENSNLLQYSCLENPTDRGAWRAAVHGVAKSWTRLSNWARRKRYALEVWTCRGKSFLPMYHP